MHVIYISLLSFSHHKLALSFQKKKKNSGLGTFDHFFLMSFLVYCLLLILYLDASNARHVGVIDTELHDQKYHIPRKGRVQDHVKKEEQRKSLSRSGTTPFLLDGIEDAQGNDQITSFPDQVAVKTEKWRRHSRRTEKKNDPDFLEEVEVTDYAQSRRKPPIHN